MCSFDLWVQVFMIVRAKECSSHNCIWKWWGLERNKIKEFIERMRKKKKMKREWNVFEMKIRAIEKERDSAM